ncbi:MAG: phenylalanine--tRNA ligase subunit alpha [bacterium]
MQIIKQDYLERWELFTQNINQNLQKLTNATSSNKKILLNQIKKDIENAKSEFLSKKGVISNLLQELSKLTPAEKKQYGKQINEFKQQVEETIKNISKQIELIERQIKYSFEYDLSIDYSYERAGKLHILTLVQNELLDVFSELGFEIVDGIEIEDEYHNFEALNIPADHPAREMWDTFFFDHGILRTHTSNMQIRILETRKPPLRVVSSGKCYRRDNMDSTHSFQFHQLEGFAVEPNLNFLDLIRTLYKFVNKYFGQDTKVNFTPSYFPFTEPSAEMSISCFHCKQSTSQCSICKGTGWIEILGCGMINPLVLQNLNIDYDKFQGFAFGMGIERIAMIKYKIPDIRLFFENYVEFNQMF